MPETFAHHPWTVNSLITGIDSGQIRLPDLQRPFVWPNSKARDLFDSMYKGFPVGQIMLWEASGSDRTKDIGTDDKSLTTSLLVIDGQQRLTSMFAVITGVQVIRENYDRENIVLSFNPISERFAVPNNATRRSREWINDIRTIFEAPIKARKQYLQGLSEPTDQPISDEREQRIEEAINRVYDIGKYEFQAVQLKPQVQRETVADIFVRINSEGVQLSSADFILTWLSVFWEQGRAALDAFSRNSRLTPKEIPNEVGEKVTWSPQNVYLTVDPHHLLRVAIVVGNSRARLQDAYNALRGRDPRTFEIIPENREKELAKLREGVEKTLNPNNWDEFLKVLERAGVRNHHMVNSTNALLYMYAFWLVGRTEFNVPIDTLRETMARWYFMVQMTGRFSGSPETRAQEELNRLEGLPRTPEAFIEAMNAQVDTTLTDDWWTVTLPEELHTSNAYGPAFMSYVAALNILDADVLLSNLKVKDWFSSRPTVKGLERHHLFPRAYLRDKLGITTTRTVNQVANQALVEWSDNITIGDKAPDVYWPEEIAEKNYDANRLRQQRWWHALPDTWTQMSYQEFLQARRRLLAEVTREGFRKLSDPNYVPAPPSAPIGREHETAAMAQLVAEDILPAGTRLVPADGRTQTVAEVTEDGTILMDEVEYRTPGQAAKEDGAGDEDGWVYWQAELAAPTLLAQLRSKASEGAPAVH